MVRIPVNPACPNCGRKMTSRKKRAEIEGDYHTVVYQCKAGRCRTHIKLQYNMRTWRTGSAASGDLDVHWD